jgi:tRNA nucleotidyltransferase (CCA-adding enzyme)
MSKEAVIQQIKETEKSIESLRNLLIEQEEKINDKIDSKFNKLEKLTAKLTKKVKHPQFLSLSIGIWIDSGDGLFVYLDLYAQLKNKKYRGFTIGYSYDLEDAVKAQENIINNINLLEIDLEDRDLTSKSFESLNQIIGKYGFGV